VESGEERLESLEILQPADGLRGKSRFAVAGHGGTEERVSIWRAGPSAGPPHKPGAIPVPNTIDTAPADRPLTFAAYEVADEDRELGPRCYVEPSVVWEPLPEMPLFLTRDHYVNVPLDPCYQAAFRNVPSQYRAALERPTG